MNAIITAYENKQELPLSNASHMDLFEAFMWACEHNAVALWDCLQTAPFNPLNAQGLPLIVAIENQSFEMVEHLAPVFNQHMLAVLRYFLWTRRDHAHVLHSSLRKQYLSILLPNISYNKYRNKNEDIGHMFIALTSQECSLIPICTTRYIAQRFLSGLGWCYDLHHTNPALYPDPVEKTQWLLSAFAAQGFSWSYEDIQNLMKESCKFLCFESFKTLVQNNLMCEVPGNIVPLALKHLPKTQALDLLDIVSQGPISNVVANEVCQGVFENSFSFRIYNCDDDIDKRVVTTLLPYINSLSDAEKFWKEFSKRCCLKIRQWVEDNKVSLNCPNISWQTYPHILSIPYLDPLCTTYSYLRERIIKKRACLDLDIFNTPIEHWLDPKIFDALVESENLVLIEKAADAGAVLSLEHFNAIAYCTDVSTAHRLFNNHILTRYDIHDIIEQLDDTTTDVITLLDSKTIVHPQKISRRSQQRWAVAAIQHHRLDFLELFVSQGISSVLWENCAKILDVTHLDPILDILLHHCDPWENNSLAFICAVSYSNLHMAQRLAPLCDPASDNSRALSLAIEIGADQAMLDFVLQYCHPRADNAKALKTALSCKNTDVVLKLLKHFPAHPLVDNVNEEEQALLERCLAQKQSQLLNSNVQMLGVNHRDKKRAI